MSCPVCQRPTFVTEGHWCQPCLLTQVVHEMNINQLGRLTESPYGATRGGGTFFRVRLPELIRGVQHRLISVDRAIIGTRIAAW